MRNKIIKLLAIAAVGSGFWFCIHAASYKTNGIIQPVETDPARIAQLMAEFEAWRTNDTEWLESPVTLKATDLGTNVWEMEPVISAYKWTNPKVQIGLRRDGVVVWRNRK